MMWINVCLIQAWQFLQQFRLIVWHKSGKKHILFDTLRCLVSANTNLLFQDLVFFKLGVFFTYNAMLLALNKDLVQCIVKGYESDPWWIKMLS